MLAVQQTHLRFQVTVNDAVSVQEVDDVGQFPDQARGLRLGEALLSPDAVEKFSASEELGHDVRVHLVLKKKEKLLL